MHVQEKANDFAFGDSYCGSFLCNDADPKLSTGISDWDHLDLSTPKKSTSQKTCTPINLSNYVSSQTRRADLHDVNREGDVNINNNEAKEETFRNDVASSSFSMQKATLYAPKICHGCKKVIQVSYSFSLSFFTANFFTAYSFYF